LELIFKENELKDSFQIPRIVIAGTGSGVGKTTVVVSLIHALRKRGMRVASFKCGPDYLDPTYHARVSERTCHNLDGWMMGRQAVLSTFAIGCKDADIALIEGVMGLFDGFSPTADTGSTAEIAKWLSAPVLLVVDAKGMARTIAALVKGFQEFDPELQLAGVVSNFVGSEGHLALLRMALSTPPIIGGFPKSPEQAFPERHLGLHSARNFSRVAPLGAHQDGVEDARIEYWGSLCEAWFDIEQVVEISRSGAPIKVVSDEQTSLGSKRCRIGVALDEAFHFYYEDNLKRLRTLGAELIYFSPLHDHELPCVDGLYIGGGYPEIHAQALAANQSMRLAIREFGESGRPIYAECGGLMYLTDEIVMVDKTSHSMVGLVSGITQMGEKLKALGYVEVTTESDSILGQCGARFRGHQFRYSDFTPRENSSLELTYRIRKRRGRDTSLEGYKYKNILASYVHGHWASNPSVAESFIGFCIKSSLELGELGELRELGHVQGK
jgi:cobyrinic acid a,c-diamide synthase